MEELDARQLPRVIRDRLEVVFAVGLQLLGLEAALGMDRQHLLVAAVIRRRQVRDQIDQPQPLFGAEALLPPRYFST